MPQFPHPQMTSANTTRLKVTQRPNKVHVEQAEAVKVISSWVPQFLTASTFCHFLTLDVAVSLTAHGFSLQTSLLARERGGGVNNPRIFLSLHISQPHSVFPRAAQSSSSAQDYPNSLCPMVIFSALKHFHLEGGKETHKTRK